MIDIEPELLESLYWGNGYSMWHIANIFDCGDSTIRRRMIEYGIYRRDSWELTDFTFNAKQIQVFEGCMLGDGALRWTTNNCLFRNTDVHKDYLLWLQKQLGIEDISGITPVYRFVGACAPYEYELRTRVIPSIRDEHNRWYPYDTRHGTIQNRQYKVIPNDVELTPIKLLFWYIGDGGYEQDSNACFYNFLVFDDWLPLSKKICKVLDVDSGVYINNFRKDGNGIQRYRLRFNKVVTSKFFDMVDDLGFDIPDCYHYKFGE